MNEVIVCGDFAENYRRLVQDEIQTYHWSKESWTLHPLVVYFIDGDRNIQHNSLLFISDDRLHAFMKEKLVTATNTKKMQILTLVPDLWSQKYFSEYCGLSEYLI